MKKMIIFFGVMGAVLSMNAMEEQVVADPSRSENHQQEAFENEQADRFMTLAYTYGVERKQGVYRSGLDLLRIYNAASPGSKKVLNQLSLLSLELSIEQLSQELMSQGVLDAVHELHAPAPTHASSDPHQSMVSARKQAEAISGQGMVEVEDDAAREVRYRAYADLGPFISVLERYTERNRLSLLFHYSALCKADNARVYVEGAEFLVHRVLHKSIGELIQEEFGGEEPKEKNDDVPAFYGAGMRAPLPVASLVSPDGGPNWKKGAVIVGGVGGVALGAVLLQRWWKRREAAEAALLQSAEPVQRKQVQGKIVPHDICTYLSWSRDKAFLPEHEDKDFAVVMGATFRDKVDPAVILRGLNHFLTVIAPVYLSPTIQKVQYDTMIANVQKYQKALTETVRAEQTDTGAK